MGGSTIRVFTFKQGLLSALAHDLQLTLREFRLELTGAQLAGVFALGSLRVDGAVKRGRLEPALLRASDHATIEHTAREILHTDHYPEASFHGELERQHDESFAVVGELTLVGRARPLSARCRLAERVRCGVELLPSRWGIAPYRAMGGALQLKDRVLVELDLAGAGLDATKLPPVLRWAGSPSDDD